MTFDEWWEQYKLSESGVDPHICKLAWGVARDAWMACGSNTVPTPAECQECKDKISVWYDPLKGRKMSLKGY